MTQPATTDTLAPFRARNALIRAVHNMLKGKSLDTRERKRELVITRPHHPEHGRVYITLASGEVSHARTIWTYLGHLHGHGTDRDPDDEPAVDAEMITAALTQPPTPTCPHTENGLH